WLVPARARWRPGSQILHKPTNRLWDPPAAAWAPEILEQISWDREASAAPERMSKNRTDVLHPPPGAPLPTPERPSWGFAPLHHRTRESLPPRNLPRRRIPSRYRASSMRASANRKARPSRRPERQLAPKAPGRQRSTESARPPAPAPPGRD